MNRELTLGSLFDGIGGFPYAASFYGIRSLWASEIVPECISVTKRHFPDMEHVGDITKLHGGDLPPVDIITFGSPCQDFSCAAGANRRGLDGERSGLFLEAIRIIREMQEATDGRYPQIAILENVPGALSSNGRRDYQAMLEAFTNAKVPMPQSGRWTNAGMVRGRGVDLAWCVYDAQHFGTAQRRRRLFVVADFRAERAGEILFVPKSLSGYFEAGGTPRQGASAYAENGVRAAGAGIEVLNDQGGNSLSVEKGGVSPTLRSQTHGNLPVVAAGFDLQQITSKTNRSALKPVQPTLCGAGNPHIVTAPLCMATGQANAEIMDNRSPTLVAGHEQPIVTHSPSVAALCMGTAQANASILDDQSPTLTCAHGQAPILIHPDIAGTLCASGAGLSRPAGQGNELDFCVVSAGFKYKASSHSGTVGYQEEKAPTLMAGQQSGVAIMENELPRTAGVDCRNLRETDEISGTLLAKAASGGYSLNYQNPVRTGLCVRRLTPKEAERLQGYPDGWTEYGADGKPISDTKRYQMLGNSVAVPCVAYIMQGIREVVDREGN